MIVRGAPYRRLYFLQSSSASRRTAGASGVCTSVSAVIAPDACEKSGGPCRGGIPPLTRVRQSALPRRRRHSRLRPAPTCLFDKIFRHRATSFPVADNFEQSFHLASVLRTFAPRTHQPANGIFSDWRKRASPLMTFPSAAQCIVEVAKSTLSGATASK